jgi:acetyl-CoA synthetase
VANIETFTQENRVFEPAPAFVQKAAISGMPAYRALCDEAARDYEGFWARLAREHLQWQQPFSKTLNETDAPFYKWFEDGKLNVSYNCLDVNLGNGNADKTAIIFESDDGKVTPVTYRELYGRVCRFANGLKSLGIKKGDRVVIYMPMSIEGVVAMQACARIGATHSVVFRNGSSTPVRSRC